MPYTQDQRLIAIDTPLGKDVLLLQGFSGHEGVSQLFHFDVEVVSEDPEVAFEKIVGQRVTIRITLPEGHKRYVNGFVSRFVQHGQDERFTYYRVEVVPWLWFLTRTTDCRIFQKMTVPDIIEKIFTDLGFPDFRNALEGTFEPREYCVQYRETDFNFVSRLMEQYGLCYFFEHEKNKHTLVLANAPAGHPPCSNQERARCAFGYGGVEEEDVINDCQVEQELRPGKYALTDYNFETPSTSLMANVASTVAVGGNSKYELYDYPGEHAKKAQGDQLAKLRMEEEEATHFVLAGESTCRAFTAGYRVTMTDHYRKDLNKAYTLLEVQHNASVGEAYVSGKEASEFYTNHFTCIPHATPYRPPRVTPKPIVQGPQTAVVVGKAGEEIWTEKHGRVKVQFHWDREGKRDENSSCWIRVSHPWAGKNWGAVAIPRIGQEVIVDFLEGDPDQPIITGRVYNAEQMPPYALPAGGVVSGIKSNSTKGGGGYNEMSMDDTKGKEKITIHAQYDMGTTVEHDDTQTVHNNRMITVDGTHTEHVKGAVTEDYDTSQKTTVANDIIITSKATKIHITAATEIQLHVGASKLLMDQSGKIELSGTVLAITGKASVATSGGQITSKADERHMTSGSMIISEAKGANVVKGGTVLLN
jgi:type VI secretion system secreted protein VgrG